MRKEEKPTKQALGEPKGAPDTGALGHINDQVGFWSSSDFTAADLARTPDAFPKKGRRPGWIVVDADHEHYVRLLHQVLECQGINLPGFVDQHNEKYKDKKLRLGRSSCFAYQSGHRLKNETRSKIELAIVESAKELGM